MKTPPMLLAGALLFWGWQSGLWMIALPLAIVFEGSRFLKVRWDFSDDDFKRIWNLCMLLFLGALVLGFLSNEQANSGRLSMELSLPARRNEALTKSSHAALVVFQWMPLLFLPLMIAQVFSTREKIPLAPLSIIARRQMARTKYVPGLPPPGLNVSYCYFLSCLLAASTVSSDERGGNPAFFWGMAVLLGWALWSQRNRRYKLGSWVLLLVLATGLGYAGHKGILQAQKLMEQFDAMLFSRFGRHETDPNVTRTALGSIGRIKQSGRIILRVQPETGPVPELLREASYNQHRGAMWFASQRDFGNFDPDIDGTSWTLLPGKVTQRSAIISKYLSGGHGILPCPLGVSRLKDLPAFFLQTNNFGALKIDGPGLVNYLAEFDQGSSIDSGPGLDDYLIPENEQFAVEQAAEELHLAEQAGISVEKALEKVEAYFQDKFSYTIYQKAGQSSTNQTALSKFLLETHKGHCEYFATATVLMLRQAGIPARYAVGYSVQERSGKKYVVRGRHAHAWCLVWYGGAWHDFDTTPPNWNAVESSYASFWEPVRDFFSRIWFEFSKWRWDQGDKRKYVFWILIPLLVLMLSQLLLKKQWARFQRHRKAKALARDYPGLDSEFYLLLQQLEEKGLKREPGETLGAWLERIQGTLTVPAGALQPLLKLHYTLRFDPKGLSVEHRAALKSEVSGMLERIKHVAK
jgi:protein-glutamine gamma-glutamyltransferase